MQTNDLLTVREAAERLKCSEKTVYRYQTSGVLPIMRVGDSRSRYTSARAVSQLITRRRSDALRAQFESTRRRFDGDGHQ